MDSDQASSSAFVAAPPTVPEIQPTDVMDLPENHVEEGEWKEVRRRSPGKLSDEVEVPTKKPLPSYVTQLRSNSVSFHFSNFPPSWQKSEMWSVFSGYGAVSDIHLPRISSPSGYRFGFVRFFKVSVRPLLLERLNDIWVGSFKLVVRSARLGGVEITQDKRNTDNLSQMKGKIDSVPDPLDLADEVPLKFIPNPAEAQWLEKCLIGIPAPVLDLDSIISTLREAGYDNSQASRLEGGEVLIRLKSTEDQSCLLKDDRTQDKLCIHSMRPWRLLNGKPARSAWFRLRGTPLHCWGESFFNEIANRMGSLIKIDEKTLQLTFARNPVAPVTTMALSSKNGRMLHNSI